MDEAGDAAEEAEVCNDGYTSDVALETKPILHDDC
jgi:hypothetical protein